MGENIQQLVGLIKGWLSDHTKYVPELHKGDSYNNAIVIDKGRQHLYAYDKEGNLAFHTPVSTGRRLGQKQEKGDNRTPVGKFSISRFEPNRDPKEFGDPRFWRLYIPGHSGFGIHGSAGHEERIGFPASHGCIRMPNDSLDVFQHKYKPVPRQTVYILGEDGKYKKGGNL